MSQKIEMQWSKSNTQLINDLGIKRQLNLFTAQTMARLMNPYMPMNSGLLGQNYVIEADEKSSKIAYKSPYAHYQYYGELMLAPNGSSWARRGEKKYYAGKPLKYSKQMHPLATSKWDKAMMNAKKDIFLNEISDMRKKLAK